MCGSMLLFDCGVLLVYCRYTHIVSQADHIVHASCWQGTPMAQALSLVGWMAGWRLSFCLRCQALTYEVHVYIHRRARKRTIWGPFLENRSPGRILRTETTQHDGTEPTYYSEGTNSDRANRPADVAANPFRPHQNPTATVEFCAYLGKRRGGRMGRMEGPLWVVVNDGTSTS